ncbi:PTS sugar transporter subunit IIA [Catenulispora subtropica]|uniref:Mannitol-specific phosphotransferase enzyme IIA component n=1 Tax=Catenulispora subtropica TaxID=450798 RepID=A0ABN2T1R3_9ACTN
MSDVRDGLRTEQAVRVGVHAADKETAIRACGELLVEAGAVEAGYVEAMLAREDEISTFIGEGVAIPHGTLAGRALVRRDTLAVVRLAAPVDWGDGDEVVLCVAIAALGEGHLDVLADLAEILMDPARAEALRAAIGVKELIRLLTPDGEAE